MRGVKEELEALRCNTKRGASAMQGVNERLLDRDQIVLLRGHETAALQ